MAAKGNKSAPWLFISIQAAYSTESRKYFQKSTIFSKNNIILFEFKLRQNLLKISELADKIIQDDFNQLSN